MTTAATTTVARRFFDEAWSRGDLDVLDDLVDGGYRSHIRELSVPRMSRWTGAAILRVEIAAYRSGMPDARADVTDVVADGDRAVAFFRFRGANSERTVLEPFAGARDEEIEATGMGITASGVARLQLRDGRIAEAEIAWVGLGPMDQLRVLAGRSVELAVGDRPAAVTLR